MTGKKKYAIALIAAVSLGLGADVWASAAPNDPVTPPWVDPGTGEIDQSKLPAQLPVAVGNGDNTIEGCVKTQDLYAPPPGDGVTDPAIPVIDCSTGNANGIMYRELDDTSP